MKKNKTIHRKLGGLLVIVILTASSLFTSCESYLDIDEYIYDRTTIDSVFTSKLKLIEYMNGAVNFLPNEGAIYRDSPTPGGQAADEFFSQLEYNGMDGMLLLIDDITPESGAYAGLWSNMYKGIRKANIIIARMPECKDLTDLERRDYMGRAYFLRGYFYYTLLRHYGPVPILPDIAFETDASADIVSAERDTWDDCAEYIYKNMEQAAALLLSKRERAFEYVPTSGAALSVIARLRLYQASPWYNGNTRYSQWTRSDGRHFISQEYNPERWGMAAAAFKRVIDTGNYKLNTVEKSDYTLPLPATVSDHSFPDGAGNIDPYLSYKQLFDGSTLSALNPEYIFYRPASTAISTLLPPALLGGKNGFNIPLDFIESYRMADGRPYSEATEEERSWEAIGNSYSFSKEYVVGSNVAKRDTHREPRFYASIGYNHCIWPGTSYMGTDPYTNIEVTYYKDGTGVPKGDVNDYNRTGYTSRKFFNQEDNYVGWDYSRCKSKTAPIIRYAEILMGYVEAMNEMDGSYKDEVNNITVTRNIPEMVKYFNMIRYRAGLPGITDADAASKEQMRELIQQERKVEFAFEAHRYYDLRRWGIAKEHIDTPIYGFNVEARSNEREQFYTPVLRDKEKYDRRTFKQKMYFYPIPKQVMERNHKLVQNPGWK